MLDDSSGKFLVVELFRFVSCSEVVGYVTSGSVGRVGGVREGMGVGNSAPFVFFVCPLFCVLV